MLASIMKKKLADGLFRGLGSAKFKNLMTASFTVSAKLSLRLDHLLSLTIPLKLRMLVHEL